MGLYFFVFITFAISAMIGWVTIPRIVIISKKKRLFDEINERKLHTGTIPRLGGLSFFPGSILSFALVLGLRYYYGYCLDYGTEIEVFVEFLFVLSGLFILFFTGLADDLVGVSYKNKFLAQIFAGIMLVYGGICIDNFDGLFGLHAIPYPMGVAITLLFIVFIVNAFNLIDGIDGLCSSLALLMLLTLGGWFISVGMFVYAMLAFGMMGVVCMFLLYNIRGNRMKVFMGDAGSLTLGFIIAFLALKFYSLNVHSPLFNVNSAPAVIIGILFVPAFDAARVFFMRIKDGKSPFYPDKRHIHHKLIRLGYSHLQCTGIIVMIQAAFIVMNILLSHIDINLLFALNLITGTFIMFVINLAVRKRAEKTGERAGSLPELRS